MFVIYCILVIIIIILFIYIYLYVSCGLCKCSVHLVNKVVIVTGGNSGIGFEIAKSMAERGARVILACRNDQRAKNAVNKIRKISINEDVHYRHLDHTSLDSVREFATAILRTERRLDILINNAGTITGANEETEDGLSAMVQSNYLGPFLLTSLLLPLLKASAPSRIINTSSFTHKFVNINPDNLNVVPAIKSVFTNSVCYFRTKLCMLLMTFELARRLKDTGVTANCLHPGAVNTNLLNDINLYCIKFIVLYICFPFFKTPEQGAQTAVYLAVSPEMEKLSGGYYVDCKLTNASTRAQNIELAQKLWEVSERLVSLRAWYELSVAERRWRTYSF